MTWEERLNALRELGDGEIEEKVYLAPSSGLPPYRYATLERQFAVGTDPLDFLYLVTLSLAVRGYLVIQTLDDAIDVSIAISENLTDAQIAFFGAAKEAP